MAQRRYSVLLQCAADHSARRERAGLIRTLRVAAEEVAPRAGDAALADRGADRVVLRREPDRIAGNVGNAAEARNVRAGHVGIARGIRTRAGAVAGTIVIREARHQWILLAGAGRVGALRVGGARRSIGVAG